MTYAISKRAWEINDLWEQIASIWHNNEGFFENFFRISSYLIPFVPGFGWTVFILEKIASFFGFGLADLGKMVDRIAGFEPSATMDISEADVDQSVGKVIKELLLSKQSATQEELVKQAYLGMILKLIGAIPKIIRGIWAAIKFLLLAFGFSKVGEIYTATTGTTKAPGELYLEQEYSAPTESGNLTEENIGNLLGLT